MKFSKLFLLVALAIISHYAAHAAEIEIGTKKNAASLEEEEAPPAETEDDSPSSSHRRFLIDFQPLRNKMTCNKYPRVCRSEGSAGPDCCKKKCVNVETDQYNCGRCGKKCKHSKICCKGKCVNPMFNVKHCGGCNNECSKGSLCVYGMCDYA
ncbi:stigma-specific STIG1-like protein 1 [Momordica charantia]|uniref:Stigma-specific STIG1-like protein 1 n=1 Tax=Momordica charantia TaxID=3673 RepID=A0A6J1C8S4_MOMCH|nr:stigma-specific STIG1-like protein 1 [Momordica charantia]